MTAERLSRLEGQMIDVQKLIAAHEERLKSMATGMEELKETLIGHSESVTNAIEAIKQCDTEQNIRHEKVTSQVDMIFKVAAWVFGIVSVVIGGFCLQWLISRFL